MNKTNLKHQWTAFLTLNKMKGVPFLATVPSTNQKTWSVPNVQIIDSSIVSVGLSVSASVWVHYTFSLSKPGKTLHTQSDQKCQPINHSVPSTWCRTGRRSRDRIPAAAAARRACSPAGRSTPLCRPPSTDSIGWRPQRLIVCDVNKWRILY